MVKTRVLFHLKISTLNVTKREVDMSMYYLLPTSCVAGWLWLRRQNRSFSNGWVGCLNLAWPESCVVLSLGKKPRHLASGVTHSGVLLVVNAWRWSNGIFNFWDNDVFFLAEVKLETHLNWFGIQWLNSKQMCKCRFGLRVQTCCV